VLYLDASRLRAFRTCPELYRRRYMENIVPDKVAIHLEFGTAIHKMHELFWCGAGYDQAYQSAYDHLTAIDQTGLTPMEKERLEGMWDMLPECVAGYYELHDGSVKPQLLEAEFPFPTSSVPTSPSGVILCGRIDRYNDGCLTDVKTVSAVGRNWKSELETSLVRDVQLPLYDYYLFCNNYIVQQILVEVLIKPYRKAEPRWEVLDLTAPIVAGRERFKQQLDFQLREMVHYHQNYMGMKPWPMSSTACVTKYGVCDYASACIYGDIPRIMASFKKREEHLKCIARKRLKDL